jgi:hypothetical protein
MGVEQTQAAAIIDSSTMIDRQDTHLTASISRTNPEFGIVKCNVESTILKTRIVVVQACV